MQYPNNDYMQEGRKRFWRNTAGAGDGSVAQLMIFLWPKSGQQNGTGALSHFVRAHAIGWELQHAYDEWRSVIQARSNPSNPDSVSCQWMLDHPPASAYTRWSSIEALRQMARNFGPNVSTSEFDAAIADFGANHTPAAVFDNFQDANTWGIIGVSA